MLSASTYKGINLLKRLRAAPIPRFIDDGPGSTVIQLQEGDFRLDRRQNGFSLAAPDETMLDYQYEQATVNIRMEAGGDSYPLDFLWDLSDRENLRGRIQLGGNVQTCEGSNDDFIIAVAEALERLDDFPEKGPASQAIKDLCYYATLSDRFEAEILRRIASFLPSSYYSAVGAIGAGDRMFLLGCAQACWLCALATTTGPTPDDLIWCGLCLACKVGTSLYLSVGNTFAIE